jgi:hypothetical protein
VSRGKKTLWFHAQNARRRREKKNPNGRLLRGSSNSRSKISCEYTLATCRRKSEKSWVADSAAAAEIVRTTVNRTIVRYGKRLDILVAALHDLTGDPHCRRDSWSVLVLGLA